MRWLSMRRARVFVLTTILTLTAGTIASPVSAGTAPPGECPTIMRVAELEVGMRGRAWAVTRGRTPEPFRVEVLGVLRNLLAPGRHLIVAEVSDVVGSDIIEHAHGIWAGISGAPAYVDGKLIGSVSWGFSGSSRIIGVTPAQDIVKVLDYGASAADPAARVIKVAVPREFRAELAARVGVSEARASSFSRLPLPVAISGLSAQRRDFIQEALDHAGVPAVVTSASRAVRPAGGATFSRPVPGGNFAGVIAYGDATAYGVGTTTYVCGDDALAFGHPFFFSGPTALGANEANTIGIIPDPVFGSFTFTNLNARRLFGTVDQDRLAAIRAALGDMPALIPVTSKVTATDLGRTRNGRSDITSSQFLPGGAASHLLDNIDVVMDEIGDGSSSVVWTVNGRRANGDPWTLSRRNLYASPFDISFESIFEMLEQIATIEFNPFEKVTFDNVRIGARVDDDFRQYTIQSIYVSKNGGQFRRPESLAVRGGDDLVVRVFLRQFRGNLTRTQISLEVPRVTSGDSGFLQVVGGRGGEFEPEACLFDPEACAQGTSEPDSFAELLRTLEGAPKNNHLRADLVFFSFEGGETTRTKTRALDRVVQGQAEIPLFVP